MLSLRGKSVLLYLSILPLGKHLSVLQPLSPRTGDGFTKSELFVGHTDRETEAWGH